MIIDVDDVRWAAVLGQPGQLGTGDKAPAAAATEKPAPARERRRRPDRRREPLNRTGSRERRGSSVPSLEYDAPDRERPRPPG